MTDPRYITVKLLDKTFKDGSYSNIQLGSGLERFEMSVQDRKFCTALYYGVIQRKITLDYILSQYCSRPPVKMDNVILNILRCGLYQILYMKSIPDRASVNECVILAKKFGKTSASGMVNAVLRNFIRNGKRINYESCDKMERYSVMYSIPAELAESLIFDYGEDIALRFMQNSVAQGGTVFIRRNPLKCTHEELIREFSSNNIFTEDGLCYRVTGNVIGMDAFRKGYFHVQDITSQMCCEALAPSEKDIVLDICSAPGGKAFTMAEMMNGRGEIHAFDLHENRVKLIRDGTQRLGLNNIKVRTGNAEKFDESLPKYTKILCDVVCSGIGVIRHKPEIKYRDLSEYSGLPQIQYNILENALKYLSVGGEMVYSTCTLRKAENDDVVKRLLDAHPEIELCRLPEFHGKQFDCPVTIFPDDLKGDGFFIAKVKKIE